jgi:hypothetical protein
MSAGKRHERHYLSVDEMRCWLDEEIRNVRKECELRERDATEFATAYATGTITREGAHKRLDRYENRWGSALRGFSALGFKTDDAIITAIDRADGSRERWLKRVEREPGSAPNTPGRGRRG